MDTKIIIFISVITLITSQVLILQMLLIFLLKRELLKISDKLKYESNLNLSIKQKSIEKKIDEIIKKANKVAYIFILEFLILIYLVFI